MELIATDAQRLTQEPKITLFEIDTTQFGTGILRFTPAQGTNMPSVMFGGETYQGLPIEASGFEWNGTGTAPRPTLSLNTVSLVFLRMIVNTDDLVGCPVRRIRTYKKYLDGQPEANPDAHFPIDHYRVERKTSQKRKEITFELATPIDQQGKMIPGRQVMRDTCMHRFRYWAGGRWNYAGVTCPYAGPAMFEPNGTPTTDPTKARCGKKIRDCKLHFGENATLPMFAFPGVGRIS